MGDFEVSEQALNEMRNKRDSIQSQIDAYRHQIQKWEVEAADIAIRIERLKTAMRKAATQ